MISTRYILERTQTIPYPPERVFPFFAEVRNLEHITPKFLHFQIVTPMPIGVHVGTLIEYRIKIFGIPIHWRTRIDELDRPKRFVDRQVTGPYDEWVHLHEFQRVPAGTQIRDVVRYRMPMGFLGIIAHRLFVSRMLGRIFDYRRSAISENFSRGSTCEG